MKKYFVTLLLMVFCLVCTQAQTKVTTEAESHIRQGNSQKLSKYFGESVELNFDGKKQNYSRNQAEFVMKDFFSKNPPNPSEFENYHKGNSANLSYSIIKYSSSAGSYRVFMKIKNDKGQYFIHALDFTKE